MIRLINTVHEIGSGPGGAGGGMGSVACPSNSGPWTSCTTDQGRAAPPNATISQREGGAPEWRVHADLGNVGTLSRHCVIGGCEIIAVGVENEGGGCGNCGAGAGQMTVSVGTTSLQLTQTLGYGDDAQYDGVATNAGWVGDEPISVVALGGDGGYSGRIPPFEGHFLAPPLVSSLNVAAPTSIPLNSPLPITWVPGSGSLVIEATSAPYTLAMYYATWTSIVRCVVPAGDGHFEVPALALRELGLKPASLTFQRITNATADAGTSTPVRLQASTSVGPQSLQVTCR